MQTFAILGLLALLSSGLVFYRSRPATLDVPSIPSSNEAIDFAFNSWLHNQNKFYFTPAEKSFRKSVFAENYKLVEQMNRVYSFKSELNKFADLTEEERASFANGFVPSQSSKDGQKSEALFTEEEILEQQPSVDWRTKGAVTPVVSQGQCGDSPYWSATVGMEGMHFLSTGQLVPLSTQQITDCSTSFGNQGCNGGWMESSFKYLMAVGGQESAVDYPYAGKDGKCTFNKAKISAKIGGYQTVGSGDCKGMLEALTKQPVSTAINANPITFYKGGIFDLDTCSPNPNHGIGVVGYGTENGKNFWIAKNTYGTGWGEAGYIRLSRDVLADKGGICGICLYVSYPTAP